MNPANHPIFWAVRVFEEVLNDDGTFYTPHEAETALRGAYHYIRRQVPALEQEVRERHERLGLCTRIGGEDAVNHLRQRLLDLRRPRTAVEELLDWWNGKDCERSVTHRFYVFLYENGPRREEFASASHPLRPQRTFRTSSGTVS